MSTSLEQMMRETLGNLDGLSGEKVHALIQEALKTFMALKELSRSEDPKEREEAYTKAMNLKQAILAQTEEISKQAGLHPKDLSTLAENPDVFSPEMWLELSSAKQELEDFQHQLGAKLKKSHPPKKNKTAWIPG